MNSKHVNLAPTPEGYGHIARVFVDTLVVQGDRQRQHANASALDSLLDIMKYLRAVDAKTYAEVIAHVERRKALCAPRKG